MDIPRKIELVKASVQSIVTHTDIDSAVRKGALDEVIRYCDAQKAELDSKTAAQIASLTGEAEANG